MVIHRICCNIIQDKTINYMYATIYLGTKTHVTFIVNHIAVSLASNCTYEQQVPV